VTWRLSEPAPGSWWKVLRATGGGGFAEVARVRADPGVEQAWSDTSPPGGTLRYRLRRESVDRRYEWVSGEARWPAKARGPRVLLATGNPAAERVGFEVLDAAAGALEVALHDVQGRMMWRRRVDSSGTGRDAFTIEAAAAGARLRSGIYFLRARDAEGHPSATTRIVIMR
jgi:hypothetical protein